MKRSLVRWPLVFVALALTACSSNPQPEAPAPSSGAAAAPEAAAPAAAAAAQPATQLTLAGEWDVRLGGGGVSMMRLISRGAGFVGVLQPFEGVPALGEPRPGGYQIRSAVLEGNRATMDVDFDGDDGRIVATFRGRNQLDGTISSRRLSTRITLLRR